MFTDRSMGVSDSRTSEDPPDRNEGVNSDALQVRQRHLSEMNAAKSDPGSRQPAQLAIPDGTAWASQVCKLLDGIGRAQRDVLELTYFKGFAQRDIAAKLGIPPQRVSTLVASGLQQLATLIETAPRP
jgi:RNA polymerase sigma factor (sigma-70 family)